MTELIHPKRPRLLVTYRDLGSNGVWFCRDGREWTNQLDS